MKKVIRLKDIRLLTFLTLGSNFKTNYFNHYLKNKFLYVKFFFPKDKAINCPKKQE